MQFIHTISDKNSNNMRETLMHEFALKYETLREYAIKQQKRVRKRLDVPFLNSIGKAIAIWCVEKQDFIAITCIPNEDTDELFVRIDLTQYA